MEEEEGGVTSPLLLRQGQEKVYHPGCPGCANDRRKELQEGLPYKEFLYVWIICLATCKQSTSFLHFIPAIYSIHFAYLIPHISISCLI
jgi:hypothetical protein